MGNFVGHVLRRVEGLVVGVASVRVCGGRVRKAVVKCGREML